MQCPSIRWVLTSAPVYPITYLFLILPVSVDQVGADVGTDVDADSSFVLYACPSIRWVLTSAPLLLLLLLLLLHGVRRSGGC